MIWPALVLLRIGRSPWIPIPIIFLWPLLIVLWLASLVRYLLPQGSKARSIMAALGAVTAISAAMSGTRVSVDPAQGPKICVTIV